MQDARILTIERAVLDRVGRFQGFLPGGREYLDAIFAPGAAQFRPRAAMELDPRYKQIIPYVVLTCGPLVFTYRRGKSGGEARLHARRSVGVGGHVDESDVDQALFRIANGHAARDAYHLAVERELAEEVAFPDGTITYKTDYGLLNDDSEPVGEVHLGLVHRFELDTPAAVAREDCLADAAWRTIAEVVADIEAYERWSQFVLRHLAGPPS